MFGASSSGTGATGSTTEVDEDSKGDPSGEASAEANGDPSGEASGEANGVIAEEAKGETGAVNGDDREKVADEGNTSLATNEFEVNSSVTSKGRVEGNTEEATAAELALVVAEFPREEVVAPSFVAGIASVTLIALEGVNGSDPWRIRVRAKAPDVVNRPGDRKTSESRSAEDANLADEGKTPPAAAEAANAADAVLSGVGVGVSVGVWAAGDGDSDGIFTGAVDSGFSGSTVRRGTFITGVGRGVRAGGILNPSQVPSGIAASVFATQSGEPLNCPSSAFSPSPVALTSDSCLLPTNVEFVIDLTCPMIMGPA